MFGQQNKLKELFNRYGWELLETRIPHADDWWIAEVWLIKSTWSPVDCYATLTFRVDDQLEDKTKRNYAVWAIELSLSREDYWESDITKAAFLNSDSIQIPIKRKWEKHIPEFFDSLTKLRLKFIDLQNKNRLL
jgi:hypothetical protein